MKTRHLGLLAFFFFLNQTSFALLEEANKQQTDKPPLSTQSTMEEEEVKKALSPKALQKLPFVEDTKQAKIYRLSVDYGQVNFTGQSKKTMLINGQLPAPTLYFEEGKKAIIHVTNKMKVPTSIHWHGILLPNFEDGVSYLTTPPIKPGKTHKFEFTLRQAGTYWYHSHTGLQEQKGLYGAILVQPKKKQYQYDHDLVLVLSDWTNEDPINVLRTLKKGSEWYALKKRSALSFWEVLTNKLLGAQMFLWSQRMPGMDISDVYYDAFLINGQKALKYPDFKVGEKVRLRVINAAASTYFWLSFGGKAPLLISADGLNVKPLKVDKILHAVAETYDFLITIPKKKALEIKATAQDGTGFATALIGKGEVLKAPFIPKPDPIKEMRKMALMHKGHSMEHGSHGGHNHGHKMEHGSHGGHSPASSSHDQSNNHRHKMEYGSHGGHSPASSSHDQSNNHGHSMDHKSKAHLKSPKREPNALDPSTQVKNTNHSHHKTHDKNPPLATKPKLQHNKNKASALNTSSHPVSYNQLQALESTAFANTQIKEVHLNLTGNMLRYVWSFNNRTLSQSDKIAIKKGETLRLHLHNKTMMHHPMHLHGHFFRVFNGQGAKAPLKHTVDVPPMQTVVIEFNPEEKGDWFFHCHILYHMKSGMSRVFSHGNERDQRLKNYPLSHVFNADRAWYSYGVGDIMTNQINLKTTHTNIKNKIVWGGTFSWVDHSYNLLNNFKAKMSYEYFVTDFFRFYGAFELEKEHTHSLVVKAHHLLYLQNMEGNAHVGVKYLLPFFLEMELSVDNQLRFELGLEYELLLFPWVEFFVEWVWNTDFGLINKLSESTIWANQFEWQLGLHYILSKNFSLSISYDNRFSYGAGLTWQF